MECNKDEATRAIEIAEKKFSVKDFAGAKKFALKAKTLYPSLDVIAKTLAIIDVYSAAAIKINGESDWYSILGTDSSSDDKTIKKQYRNMVLLLHPDKNKSAWADEAFKLVSEAWALLSDKTKRVAYDQKVFPRTAEQKAPSASVVPPASPAAHGFNSFNNRANSNARPSKTTPIQSRTQDTFWTACSNCKKQFKYARMYLDRKIQCSHCKTLFMAVEVAAQPTNTYAPGRNPGSTPNVQPMGFTNQASFQTNFPCGSFSRMAGAGSSPASNPSPHDAHIFQQACDKALRKYAKAHAAAKRPETVHGRKHPASKRMSSATGVSSASCDTDLRGDKPVKRRRVGNSGGKECGGIMANQMGMGNGGPGSQQGGLKTESNSMRDLSMLETQNMLAEKARGVIRNELSTNASAKGREKARLKERDNMKGNRTVAINGEAYSRNKSRVHMRTGKKPQGKKANEIPGDDPDAKACEPTLMKVSDPDFHNFDKDRCERSFGENQIWAAYDNDDGMPRFYAMIRSIIFSNPFKVGLCWLDAKTNSELGPLTWIGSGFSITSGEFTVGTDAIDDTLNIFSHEVKRTEGIEGSVQIYPGKGDVWALYHNWSPNWNEHTPVEVKHQYDMVEVADDYDKEQGVSVIPLLKVPGYKTIFRRQFDPQKVKRIPREEMFRFSHQVPSYLHTGEEAPKGWMELDPAATPSELLQVISEAAMNQDTEAMEQDTVAVGKGKTGNEEAKH